MSSAASDIASCQAVKDRGWESCWMLERNRNQRVAGSYASVTIVTRSCHDVDGDEVQGSPLQGF